MTLNKPWEVECYWNDPERYDLENLGIKVSGAPSTRKVIVFDVDNLTSGTISDGEIETGFITSGGQEYATIHSYDELKELIKQYI